MRYLDICSGISAPTAAWAPLGWQALCYAEIEAAPRAVLSHHYPDVPLVGDFTKIRGDEYGPVDLLVGGTPCQSFSVAGLRGGLADERGNLALEYLRLADRARPRWLVWENVPGVLSSNSGRDFGTFLRALGELGYGFAYAVLDAQHFGVPQRRRRVFVVGHLGDWRRAAAVLFERHSLSGDSPPRREKGAGTSSRATCGFDVGGTLGPRVSRLTTDECANGAAIIAHCEDVSRSLTACHTATGRLDPNEQEFIAIQERAVSENPDAGPDGAGFRDDGQAYTLEARTVPQAVCFTAKDHGADAGELAPTLRAGGHSGSRANAGVMPAVALYDDPRRFDARGIHGGFEHGDLHPPLNTVNSQQILQQVSAVRRLTPRECERLQGFPDDFTLVPYRGGMMKDGPRYKMLGNSMAVPVIRWIGERIQAVEAIADADRLAA